MVNQNMKVLILYASYGEGHRQVSFELQNQFQKQGVQNVSVVDLFAEAHPLIDRLTRYLYMKSYAVAPSFYGWTYYSTQNMRHETFLTRRFNSFGIRKLRDIIYQIQPNVVINTFPMLVMPELSKEIDTIPTYMVLTDFVLHNRWLHPSIDQYYVPTEDIKNKMIKRGVKIDKIKVSGIPIRAGFQIDSIQTAYGGQRKKFGFDPMKKIVLLMAGPYGKSTLKAIGTALLTKEDFQVVIVCGKNQTLKRELQKYFAKYEMIHVLGFVEDIPQLMKMSTCVVTKAGGLTLAEALAVNIPLILFRPVPGQEAENAQYLTKLGAALTVNRMDELLMSVMKLLTNREELLQMHQAMRSIQKPKATETVVNDILERLRPKVPTSF